MRTFTPRASVSSVIGATLIAQFTALPAPGQMAPTNDGAAETPVATLQEVVVTAEKRTSTVQNTPISISAITGNALQELGIPTAQGIAGQVPGIAVSSFGPGQAQYTIRGLSADGGEAPTVGFYLDEIPITPPTLASNGKVAIDPDLYDLARVEVLRGPQGTLYGAGSMGGTIKLITNPPDLSSFYGTSESLLSDTQGGGFNYGEKAMLNAPIADGKAALRIVGTYTHTSGWIDRIVVPNFPLETNPAPGWYGSTRGAVATIPGATVIKNVNDENLVGARASLLVRPTDRLSLTTVVLHQRIHQGGMNTFDSDPGTLAHYQPFNIAEPYSDTFDIYSETIVYNADPLSITSATGYWTRNTLQWQDASEPTQNAFLFPTFAAGNAGIGPASASEFDRTRQFSQELRFASRTDGPFTWLIGGFYSRYRFNVESYEIVPAFSAVDTGAFGTDVVFDATSPLALTQWAAFGNLRLQLTSKLSTTIGGRYYSFSNTIGATQRGILSASGGATPTIAEAAASASGTNPMVDLAYSPTHNLLLYATAAKGFREGGGNFPISTSGVVGSSCLQSLQAIGLNSAPLSYQPDTVWSYEVGEKAQLLDRKLTVDADGYYMRWSDVQQLVALACGLGFTTNASTAAIRGAELEVAARPAPQLTLSQSIGYTHAVYTQASLAAGIVSGQPLLNSPHWTASTTLEYTKALQKRRNLVLFVTNSYVSSIQNLTYGLNTIPGRDLTSGRVGLETPSWTVHLFVDNMLNRHETLADINLLSFTGPTYNRVATSQPRTVGLDFSFDF